MFFPYKKNPPRTGGFFRIYPRHLETMTIQSLGFGIDDLEAVLAPIMSMTRAPMMMPEAM